MCETCSQPCGHAGRLRDKRLRDRLICCLVDKDLWQRVLAEDNYEDLTLDKVIRICKLLESSNSQTLVWLKIPDQHWLYPSHLTGRSSQQF